MQISGAACELEPCWLEVAVVKAGPCTEVLLCSWEGHVSEEEMEGSCMMMGWANI